MAQTDEQRLQRLRHNLEDVDLEYDHEPDEIERMKRDLAELETKLNSAKADGLT